ncbi:MAG TPA: flippase [Phycisphaerae bacterium]|nr:flippase [Phycisphaerae bacterium]HRY66809.1 flippase [Phycisphaerae bacterium]HSA26867.1 flippase [Phycisphaerae bacterium]
MLKRDISATFVGNLALIVIMLGTATITSRALGPAGRGLLAMAFLIPTITSTFALLGQEVVNNTFAGLYKEARTVLFFHSLFFTAVGAVVSSLVIGAYFWWLPVPRGKFALLDQPIIWAMCFIAPMTMFNTLMFGLLRGSGRVVTAAMLRIVNGLVLLVLLFLFLVVLRHGVLAAVWVNVVASLIGGGLTVLCLRKDIDWRSRWWDREMLMKSLRFGWPICLATFAGFLVYRIDQGIQGYMVDEFQLGLYTQAVGVAEHLKVLPSSISTAFLPRLANELETRRQQVPAVFRMTVIASAAAMVGTAFVGGPGIVLLFGWEFLGSIPPFLLLLPGVAILGGASILASDLLTRQKPRYNMTVAWVTLAVSVTLNLSLIPVLGICGSAIAASLSYLVAMMLWIRFYVRESGRAIHELWPGRADLVLVWRTGWEVLGKLVSRIRRRPAAAEA